LLRELASKLGGAHRAQLGEWVANFVRERARDRLQGREPLTEDLVVAASSIWMVAVKGIAGWR
jgi:hypothetical protein